MGMTSITDNILNTIDQKSYRKCHNTLVKLHLTRKQSTPIFALIFRTTLLFIVLFTLPTKSIENKNCVLRRQCSSLIFFLAPILLITSYVHACIQVNSTKSRVNSIRFSTWQYWLKVYCATLQCERVHVKQERCGGDTERANGSR